MKLTSIVAGVTLVWSVALTAPCSAQSFTNPYAPGSVRITNHGEAVLQREIARIATTIRAIRNDRHDDGGYRMRAIRDLERSQDELRRAIQWDRAHGGG